MSIHLGHDDPEVRQKFGSDSARLVYGLDRENERLVHISVARRGLACGLICPHCKATLIANLKDDLKAAHFAHQGPACGGGGRDGASSSLQGDNTKRIAANDSRQFAAHGTYELLIAEEREIAVDRATLEHREHIEVIPDLLLQVGALELFVEIAVTHPCGEEKIGRLRRLGTAAVEIDMSSVPRNATPDAVRQAVLSAAPRKWLFNVRIERAIEDLRLREQRDAEACARRLASAARRKMEAYDRTRRSAGEQKLRIKDLPALRYLGLRQHLGVEIGGTGCFTVRPETW